MSTGTNISISADDAGATATFQKIAQAEGSVAQGAATIATQYKQATREQAELARAAKRFYDQTRSPAEKHNATLRQLDTLLKASKIDQDTYTRAVQRSAQALRQAESTAQAVGKAAGDAFGPSLARQVGDLASAIAPFATAAGAAAAAFQLTRQYAGEAHEEIKGLASKLMESEETFKNLWQVAQSKSEYDRLSVQTKLAMAKEGYSREEAGATVFSLQSAGLQDEAEQLLPVKRFMNPEEAVKFRSTIVKTYGKDKYSGAQTFSALDLAAGKSEYDMAGEAKILKETAGDLKPLGTTAGEILGMSVPLSYRYSEPERLITGMSAAGKEATRWREKMLAKKRFTEDQLGTGLIGTLDAMRKLDPEYYNERKISELEFGRFARALEAKHDEAVASAAEMDKALASRGEQFQKRVAVPTELSRIQRRRVAELQREVANEPRAVAQLELETLKGYGGTLSGIFGTPLSTEKMVESAMETGATYGFQRKTQELAGERVLDIIRTKAPDVFERHLAGKVPVKSRYFYPADRSEGAEPVVSKSVDLAGPMTYQQQTALADAMRELTVAIVEDRAATAANTEATRAAAQTARPAPNPVRNHRDHR